MTDIRAILEELSALAESSAPAEPRRVDPVLRFGLDGRVEWRCLACLAGGIGGDDATVDLAVEVHSEGCGDNQPLVRARMDLVSVISGVSEDEFAAGWLIGIEQILLRRGGLWALLAEQYGWPVGYRGVSGWAPDLAAALHQFGLTEADMVDPLPVRPERNDGPGVGPGKGRE